MLKKDKSKENELQPSSKQSSAEALTPASQDKKEESTTENPFVQEAEEIKETSEQKQEQPEMVCYEDFCELKNKFEKLEDDKKTVDSHYIRLAADFDNFRKRQAQEREGLLKYGAEDTIKKLLPVMDTFERAQKSFKELDDPEKLRESFDAVRKQFMDALEKLGVEKIETVGKEFDPNLHEAIMQTPSEEHPDNIVIAELQSGYKLCDKILRPALVNVAVNE